MEPILFFIIMLGIVGVVSVVAIKNKQSQLRAWQAFAQQQHLKLQDAGTWSNPRMVGRYRDLDVTLQIEVHGSGKHKKTYTRASARFPMPMPRGLNITSEGFTDRLAKLVGGQDIEIGHAALDRQLRIRGEDVPAVLALMEGWRARNAIAAFLARDPKATVTQHQCSILRHGFVHAPVELRGMLEGVCRAVSEVRQGLEDPGARPVAEEAPTPEAPDSPPAERFAWEPDPSAPVGVAQEVLGLLEPHGAVISTTHETMEITEITPEGTHVQRQNWLDGQLEDASEVFTAPAPPSSPPPPAPSHPATEPAPSAPPPAAPPSPVGGPALPLEDLVALEDRGLSAHESEALVAELVGGTVALELEVERVSLTMGMGLPQELEGGHTVIGHPAGHPGPRLAVRYPSHRSDAVSGLGYGDRLELQGRFVAWDGFYRQAVVDVGYDPRFG
jgi:hypothetical protein